MAVNDSLGCRMFLLYTCWGGNYFFEITVSSFVYLQCNWRSDMYKSVAHCTLVVRKLGVVDIKKFSYFLKTVDCLFLAIEQEVVFF